MNSKWNGHRPEGLLQEKATGEANVAMLRAKVPLVHCCPWALVPFLQKQRFL